MDRRAQFPQAFNQTDQERLVKETTLTGVIPGILGRSPSISVIELLKELHQIRTEGTTQTHPEADKLADYELIYAFMGNRTFPKGPTKKIVSEIEGQLKDFQNQTTTYQGASVSRLQTFNPYTPGEYRKVATLVPIGKEYRNSEPFDLYAPTFHIAIDTTATTGGVLQFPNPVLKVRENMDTLAQVYEKEKDSALRNGSEEGFAKALSRFYLMALGVIHPLADGNGGSLRAVVKAETQKAGRILDISDDESSARHLPMVTAPFGFSMAFSQETGIPYEQEATFASLFKNPEDTRKFHNLYQQVIDQSFTKRYKLTEHMINAFATYLSSRTH